MNSTEIKLDKYRPFLLAVIGQECTLALCDQQGTLISIDDEAQRYDLNIALAEAENIGFQWDSGGNTMRLLNLQSHGTLILQALTPPNPNRLWWLAVHTRLSSTQIRAKQKRAINTSMLAICACIGDEFAYHSSLATMSAQLATRYDELKLFFDLDPESDQQEENRREMLTRLLNNCIKFLEIDRAIIHIPSEHVEMRATAERAMGLENEPELLQSMFAKLKFTRKPLMINCAADSDFPDLESSKAKFLSAPITHLSSEVCGLLALVRNPRQADFNAGDRNLCNAIATKISKTIHMHRDPLTGLLNRQGFTGILEEEMPTLYPGSYHALLYVDIDRFRVINDASGTRAGDALLQHIANIIKKCIPRPMTAARLDVDKFAVFMRDCDMDSAESIAEEIRANIESFQFVYNDRIFPISASLGIALLDSYTQNHESILRKSDAACFAAKQMGRNKIKVYRSNDERLIRYENEAHWISRIFQALEEKRLILYRQAIAPLANLQDVHHFEILLRMIDENDRHLPPGSFMPAAERYGLMPKLDRWIIEHALRSMHQVPATIHYSINLSGQSLGDDSFCDFVCETVRDSKIEPQRICFEITETVAIGNLNQALELIARLKSIGCSFSLDDFGSGMSSFGYLKNIPVDYLKIDGSFVKTMVDNPIEYAIVKSIHSIGHAMKLKTIAEYVENDAIIAALQRIGVDYAQGYGVHKPEPLPQTIQV